jgi:hypothetical protein
MMPKEVQREVMKLNPSLNPGSVYNIGPRLDGTSIERKDKTWRLIDESAAPLLYENHAWGPDSLFQKTELAAHRREVILHVLRVAPDGMMPMQIVRQLDACGLCKAPISKDLVKADLGQLAAAEKIRRIGRTKKWTTADSS